jgi:uncharacterized protein
MTISMFEAPVPVFICARREHLAVLDQAAAHAGAKQIDPAALVDGRLFLDMFPLSRQVRIVADMATTAYDILRHNGADIGRQAFLGHL